MAFLALCANTARRCCFAAIARYSTNPIFKLDT